jgi:outer membrane protein insertion porin family
VTEYDTVYVGANAEQTQVKEGSYLPTNRVPGTWTSLPLTLRLARDRRDSALVPTAGNYQRVFSDWSVAGDARYVRANYQFQQYLPLSKKFTFAFNTDLGWGKGLNGQTYPWFKNFYVGGLGSVRGYQQSTLGSFSRDANTGNTLYEGGAKKVVLNAEFIGPFPGAGNDKTLRMFGFVDAGYAFPDSQNIDLNKLRSSYGVGLSWISPMGPLRFSYGIPINARPEDKIQKLQFQIGTSF